MDDAIPSISTDGVGSRFVSQNEIEVAKARRDEQWRAAYARYGLQSNLVFLTNAFQAWPGAPTAASGGCLGRAQSRRGKSLVRCSEGH